MTFKTILTLWLVLASLASCVGASSSCAGWKKITTDQEATLVWLDTHDRPFLEQVTGHDEFGATQGCWK